jgi:uncharacterized membrane-anchored protein YhcB (DUF1043 family)
MNNPQVLAGIITASVTLAGVLLTLIYSLFHERAEDKRHQRQIELEERRARLEENRLAIELYNQREIALFESRIENYPALFNALMPLAKRELPQLTPEGALEIEKHLKELTYGKVSSCASADALQRVSDLRDTLVLFAKHEADIETINKRRLELFHAVHRDLGRGAHPYLGREEPQIVQDRRVHKSLQEETSTQ